MTKKIALGGRERCQVCARPATMRVFSFEFVGWFCNDCRRAEEAKSAARSSALYKASNELRKAMAELVAKTLNEGTNELIIVTSELVDKSQALAQLEAEKELRVAHCQAYWERNTSRP